MQAAKRVKVVFTVKDVLEHCANWKTFKEWKQIYKLDNVSGDARRLARFRFDEELKEFYHIMRHVDFEQSTIADRCAILQWLQSATRTQVHFPLWIYFKIAPPEEQLTFFRRWIHSRKGAWPNKWNDFFELNILNKNDNPAFLWLILFETLKHGHDKSWMLIASCVSKLLGQFENMPKFTTKELVNPKPRYHYYWKIRKIQRTAPFQFPSVRRWHDNPAAMILHERKCKYLIKYLMVVGEAIAPVAESIYFCFPPLDLNERPDAIFADHFDIKPQWSH